MKKKLIVVLSIFAAIIVLSLVLALLAIGAPLKYSYSLADAEADNLLASEIVDMISDAVVDEEGNIPEIAEFSIPPAHVNALLHVVGYRVNKELEDDGIVCSLGWDNAAVKAACSLPVPVVNTIAVRGSAAPSIENGVMHVPLRGLKVGYLPLPGSLLARDIREQDIKDEKLKLAFNAVHHLSSAPDGGLKVGVYPEKISNLIRFIVKEED